LIACEIENLTLFVGESKTKIPGVGSKWTNTFTNEQRSARITGR